MFGSETVDVALGLVFLFLLVSLICSSIKEALETVLNHRARDLRRGIQELLGERDNAGLVADFYNHPLIKALYRGPYNPQKSANLPSYIPSRTFALALLNLVRHMPATADGVTGISAPSFANPLMEIRSLVLKIDNRSVKGALLPLIDSANGDLVRARSNVEDWYDGVMDQVSGWYKCRTQQMIALIGLLLALLMNLDAISIARYLNINQTARTALIAQLQNQRANRETAISELVNPEAWLERQGGVPIGWLFAPQPEQSMEDFQHDWRRAPVSFGGWIIKLSGILLTTFAVSLGAPFWFDLLNKFMVVRSTVKPQEKSRDEESKD